MTITPVKTWAVMNDLQMPFHDQQVVEGVVKFIEELRPNGIVLNGDVVDCYEISDYDKNPRYRHGLGREVKLAGNLMGRLAKVADERVWLGGNHEDRLRRYVWRNAPAMGILPGTDFGSLFKVGDYGFTYKEYGAQINIGKLIVTHGFIVAQHSGVSAKRHFDRIGSSVLIGHTHRLGIYYRTNVRGAHAAFENGCLCKMTPEYVQYPDWQHGFSVIHTDNSGWFHVQQIPIINRKAFYYGNVKVSISGGK